MRAPVDRSIIANGLRSLIVALLLLPVMANAELRPMSSADLSAIAGGNGIALALGLDINTDSTGAPMSMCPGDGGLDTTTNCRLALQFANRGNGDSKGNNGGEWLVLKNYYGHLNISNLYLDSSYTGGASPHAATDNRFQNYDGTCLLPGCSPNNLSALQFSMPAGAPVVPGTTLQKDMELGLHIGGMAVEYGTTGYDNTGTSANGSFVGLQITDTQQTNGWADIDGRVMLYGF